LEATRLKQRADATHGFDEWRGSHGHNGGKASVTAKENPLASVGARGLYQLN
jgi:hypothetical protein